ncbi:hypothetical protein [Ferrovum sp.]|uniref:hypothetical protein n=1 Tax=Ferrovum sp. TaxID=2609467 RepID=UPI002616C2E2|nr:hypothetical protein [Ferrovum sp.]
MKIHPRCYSSPLGRYQPEPMDIEATKRNGWQEQHILVVSENDSRLDFVEREFIRRIGNRLYGGKRHG